MVQIKQCEWREEVGNHEIRSIFHGWFSEKNKRQLKGTLDTISNARKPACTKETRAGFPGGSWDEEDDGKSVWEPKALFFAWSSWQLPFHGAGWWESELISQIVPVLWCGCWTFCTPSPCQHKSINLNPRAKVYFIKNEKCTPMRGRACHCQ